jgi:hypothetical protein
MTASPEVCTKDKATVNGQTSVDSWLPSMGRTVYLSEVCTSVSKCLKAAEPVLLMQADKEAHPHPQTNKPSSVLKQ